MAEWMKWAILVLIVLPAFADVLTADRWFEHAVWKMKFEADMEAYAARRKAEREET